MQKLKRYKAVYTAVELKRVNEGLHDLEKQKLWTERISDYNLVEQ